MKNAILAMTIFVSATSFAGTGRVLCEGGNTIEAAIGALNGLLASDSMSVATNTEDSRLNTYIRIQDVNAVSAVTILNDFEGKKFGACVTIFGASSKR